MDHEEIVELVAEMRAKLVRIIEDIESEKEARVDLDDRIRELEKAFWKSSGALAVLLIILEVAMHFFDKLVK